MQKLHNNQQVSDWERIMKDRNQYGLVGGRATYQKITRS